jgi:hypothetical protein
MHRPSSGLGGWALRKAQHVWVGRAFCGQWDPCVSFSPSDRSGPKRHRPACTRALTALQFARQPCGMTPVGITVLACTVHGFCRGNWHRRTTPPHRIRRRGTPLGTYGQAQKPEGKYWRVRTNHTLARQEHDRTTRLTVFETHGITGFLSSTGNPYGTSGENSTSCARSAASGR